MNRREFMTLAARLSAAGALPAALYGCGGGSAGAPTSSLSSIDSRVASTQSLQADTASTNSSLQAENSNIVDTSSSANTASVRVSSVKPVYQTVADFFNDNSPNNYLPETYNHYLTNTGTGNVWQNLINAQQTAYAGFEQQITKLLASFRLYDFEKTSEAVSSATVQANTRAVANSSLDEGDADTYNNVESLINNALELVREAIKNGPTALISAFNGIAATLESAKNFIEDAIENGSSLLALLLQTITNYFIDNVLTEVTNNLIKDLEFDTQAETIISLSRMSLAAAAVLAVNRVEGFDINTPDQEELINNFLTASDLMARMSLTWLQLSESMINNTATMATSEITRALNSSNENFSASSDFVDDLKSRSAIMSVAGLTIKSLLGSFFAFSTKVENDTVAPDVYTTEAEFNVDGGSAGSAYSFLFQTPVNTADQALNDNNASLITEIEKILGAFISANEKEDETTVSDAVNAITPALAVSTRGSVTEIADNFETDSYNFASELANLAFQFASDTRTDAASFAEMMATYAYNFTMDIEEDAFQFAMQGMEYGYLFASRGEEVGVMADRILWMAVQIGVMADRIGEMADRIVYTEHLIVYTEMLILDFGILIYGVIKQITNLILTGMALILDREWYEPATEDLILSTIDNHVSTMLSNMNEYSLAVLENQKALREITQDALPEINTYYEELQA